MWVPKWHLFAMKQNIITENGGNSYLHVFFSYEVVYFYVSSMIFCRFWRDRARRPDNPDQEGFV